MDEASFRDPSGFVFWHNGQIYRQVNDVYRQHYETLMLSGLYDKLTGENLLVRHKECDPMAEGLSDIAYYKLLKPEIIPFISYPYEWSFSQLKEAALLTLRLQKKALEHGMTLKDATSYNVQFIEGRPVFIDTLSFERYREGEPWQAYRQFCQHFLGPLLLMSYTDVRLKELMKVYIDGIPIDMVSRLLPKVTYFKPAILSHIHLHSLAQKKYENHTVRARTKAKISKMSLRAIVDSLEVLIRKLSWAPFGTEWGDYYNNTNYSEGAFNNKLDLLNGYISEVKPELVWDLGANNGVFSRLASGKGIMTVAFDIDPAAVEQNYLAVRKNGEEKMLPLILDLTNPTPGIGWANHERMSFSQRGPADMVFALALIHHLAISNNVPLEKIARFFAGVSKWLVIEFVPKSDSQVEKLLATREDVFPGYTQECFEIEFSQYFEIVKRDKVGDSHRNLYLMKNKKLG